MKKSRLSWLSMLLILAVAVSALGACGPTPEPEVASPTEAPVAQATEAPAATEVPAGPAPGEPITEGPESVIRIPKYPVINLDPSGIPSTNDTDIQQKMFSGLLEFELDGTMVMLGAESFEVNDTADVYTFKLNQDAVWSDGKPITAHDYVWAWQHVQDPVTASGYASFAYVIKNAEKINTGEITDFDELGAKALDDYTLEVTLEQPSTFFPRLLDFPTMFPLRQDVIEEHGDDWVEPENIVSNGRWNFVEWEKDVKIVLERNPLWWAEPVAIETIEFYIMDDVLSTSPGMYEADELDISRFAPEEYARLSSDPDLGDDVQLVVASGMSFVVFDCGSPPFDDVRVRQAFNLAIDRENLVAGVLQGLGKPAYILPPPGIAGRNEDAYIGTRVYEEDVAKAQELMAEAGYPNGEGFPVVELKYSTSAQNEKLGQAIPAMWKTALNIEVNQEPTEAQAYREWFRSRDEQPFDMMLYGWGSDYEDPYNYFNTIWPSWSDLYHTHWVNEEYDNLAKEAGLETDPDKRIELYEQVDVILEREVPFAPTFYWVNPYMSKPWVQGEPFNRRQGYPVQWAQIVAQ